MNNLLKKKEYYLRPYNMYVAVFEQNSISVPTLIKVLYNDFKQPLDITWERPDLGKYEGTVQNLNQLNIRESDNISVACELIYAGSLGTRIQGLLSLNHSIITIGHYILAFAGTDDVYGKFVITYSKMKS